MWRLRMPNVTMSIDADLLKKARKIAIDKDTSLTGLIRVYLEELVAKENALRDLKAAELEAVFERSEAVVGKKTWSRDVLHER